MGYREEHRRSIEQPEAFWAEKAAALPWFKAPTRILGLDEQGHQRWFVDGEMNTAHMALDHHVDSGRGAQTAIIYDSPVTGVVQHISYAQLRDQVALAAGGLAALGVGRGDRVLIYMPMVPEAVVAMLACARLGAVHCVVFGGFAPHELAVRIEDAEPRVILSASCGIEVDKLIPYKPMLDDAIAQASFKPAHCVVLQRPQCAAELQPGRDLDWAGWLAAATPHPCVPVLATEPLYILYTSGTTGKPKGIVRDCGGHAVAMHFSMSAIYDMKPGEVFWAASDVGWVVGHSYIVYAPLLAGCTTVLYEGKPVRTPDAGAFWRVCEQHKVRALFAAPTAFRAIRKEDPEAALAAKHDLSGLERLYLAGERLDPPTYEWLCEKFKRPVLDHWWQTETGWAIAGNPAGIELLPTKAGSASVPGFGFDIHILDDSGHPLPPGSQGNIAVKLPMPPSSLVTVWRNEPRFRAGYLETFPGYYSSGDGGYMDEDGYVFVMGRTDDVINVAGHRLSTGEMEQIIAAHPAVAECAVVGMADELRGQVPLGLVLLKDGAQIDEAALEAELAERVRHEIGGIACFRHAVVVKRLPKTRSGKILRAIIRKIADGEAVVAPSTIDDPASLGELETALRARGIGGA